MKKVRTNYSQDFSRVVPILSSSKYTRICDVYNVYVYSSMWLGTKIDVWPSHKLISQTILFSSLRECESTFIVIREDSLSDYSFAHENSWYVTVNFENNISRPFEKTNFPFVHRSKNFSSSIKSSMHQWSRNWFTIFIRLSYDFRWMAHTCVYLALNNHWMTVG